MKYRIYLNYLNYLNYLIYIIYIIYLNYLNYLNYLIYINYLNYLNYLSSFFRRKKKKQKSSLLVGLSHLPPSRFCASPLGPKPSDKSSGFPPAGHSAEAWSRRCENPHAATSGNILQFCWKNIKEPWKNIERNLKET